MYFDLRYKFNFRTGFDCVDLDDPLIVRSRFKVKILVKKKGQDIIRSRFQLVFNPGALPGGVTVRVRLDATDTHGVVSSFVYEDLQTNSPPTKGVHLVE